MPRVAAGATAVVRRSVHACARSFALAVATVVLLQGVARADPPPDEVDRRYAAITASLEEGEGRARLWWYGWTIGFAGLTAGETTVALVANDGTRVDAVVSAAGSALGLGAMLFFVSRTAFEWRGPLAAYDATTPAGRLARLKEAERILDKIADDETMGHSIFAHLASDVVTLAGTFVLWAGYQRYTSGWINLIGGVVVGEAQILTMPTAGIRARRAYRAGAFGRTPASKSSWSISPTLGGAAATWSF